MFMLQFVIDIHFHTFKQLLTLIFHAIEAFYYNSYPDLTKHQQENFTKIQIKV